MLKSWRMPSFVFLATSFAVVLGACAPGSSSGPQQTSMEPAPAKTLTIAVIQPIMELQRDVVGSAATTGGEIFGIAHDHLVEVDGDARIPKLAVENISVDKGTWRANADGSMDTTWQIHRNVKWHNGTPFTSADLLFTFQVYKDTELPAPVGPELRLWTSAEDRIHTPSPCIGRLSSSTPIVLLASTHSLGTCSRRRTTLIRRP